MLRMQDYQCATHGQFEVLLDVDMRDDEARAAVRSHPCGVCGELAPSIWTKAPGLVGVYRHAVSFAGRMYDEEFLEEKLSTSTAAPDYFESSDFEDYAAETLKKNEALAAAGNLPPVTVTDDQAQAVASAIKE